MDVVYGYYDIVKETFWSERFWLPSNYSWNDLRNDDPDVFYPQTHHLYASFPICALLVILRYLCESYIFKPIGRYYGLKDQPTRAPPANPKLDSIFKNNKRPDPGQIQILSEEVHWSARRVDRWFKLKRNSSKYSLLKKFSESAWRFTFYLCAFWCGIFALWSKPFFWNTRECWVGYPKQTVDQDIYWYYMVELGFYWSLLISIFYDVKRKDFTEMVVHHVSTVTLMVFSWACNYVRIGALVLAVHDAVDYILEAAKMAKYIGKPTLCDFFFIIFTIVWLCTRLTIFPLVLLRSTIWEGLEITGMRPFPAYYVLNGLLSTLQVLNLLWFVMIAKMVCDKLRQGQTQKDVRSDSEMSDDSGLSCDEEPEATSMIGNGFATTHNDVHLRRRA